jgi:hypothetical protein
MANFLEGPIPGQSLTDTPRNAPWERPSEFDTVEDAVKFHVNKLADPDVMDDIAVAFELGADLKTMSEMIVTMGSMKGLHTVEVGMLAGPVVASFIKMAMHSMGIETPETPVSFEEAATEKEKARLQLLIDDAVEKGIAAGKGEEDPGLALLQELSSEEPEMMSEPVAEEASQVEEPQEVQEEEAPVEMPQGAGLMARRGTV